MIIGLAGPSCSGKTTLARQLAVALDAELLHLDTRWRGGPKVIVNGFPSRERPEFYDGDALLRDARRAAASGRSIVLEGFLLFAHAEGRECYPGMAAFCDRKLFLDLPPPLQRARRMARTQAGGNSVWGDLPEGHEAGVDRGWLAHGEAEWMLFGDPQRYVAGMTVLDGRLLAEEVLEQAMAAVGRP